MTPEMLRYIFHVDDCPICKEDAAANIFTYCGEGRKARDRALTTGVIEAIEESRVS